MTNKWWINQEEEFSLNVLEKKCAITLLGFVAKGGYIKIIRLVCALPASASLLDPSDLTYTTGG